jgi:hypothetical protein
MFLSLRCVPFRVADPWSVRQSQAGATTLVAPKYFGSIEGPGCCPNTFFAYLLCTPWVKVFCINLRLTSGNDKTRFGLKQLSLLIFRFAEI